MKFINFIMYDVAKAAEVAQAADKVAKMPGRKLLASYVCEGIPFPGAPPNSIISITISESESNEAIAEAQYPLALAGASVWAVPVLEVPVAGAAAEEKKYRK
ncbi:MAG: hypothetical protein FJ022_07855 [Chloroflexi bacterium]|nr:hypothetical protein [Chloroflexota bacterium]MBM3167414.1 hypothetical protein [Chloroflexota bacterium]MBM3173886.1 hypothetical protein [Chloroflexota bacterium]MBM4450688.1 hypothetical protein [Chloroflexota bacterium]